MLKSIRDFGKGFKGMVDKEINMVKDFLSQPQNRLIVGLILMGLGGGLTASAYLKVQ